MKEINISSLFANLDYNEKFELYRELWQKAENYEVLTDFPLHLDIELSGVCNLKCADCFQNGLIKRPLGLMSFHLFKKIIDEGVEKGLCAIKLQIRGESFLHPQLFECISYAKDKGVMDIQITTNGTLLDEDKIQKILNSSLDSIIFSVDILHSDGFEQKHKSRSYFSIEQAIKDLLEFRKKLGKYRPWVRLQSSIPQSDPESFERAKSYLKKKFPLADIYNVSRLHDFRDSKDAYPDLHTNYELNPCSYLMQRLAIFWDGDITTCCCDYNNRFQLGNATSHTVADAWLSAKMNNFRKIHINRKRKTMAICKHCCSSLSVKDSDSVMIDSEKIHIADHRRNE